MIQLHDRDKRIFTNVNSCADCDVTNGYTILFVHIAQYMNLSFLHHQEQSKVLVALSCFQSVAASGDASTSLDWQQIIDVGILAKQK